MYPAIPGVADTDRSPFVNIDSTTVTGIERAKRMGFADAGLAQVVVSPFVFELNDLFTATGEVSIPLFEFCPLRCSHWP